MLAAIARTWWCLVVIFVVLLPRSAGANAEAVADKTLSPYFVVEGGDASKDRLPLASTKVEVAISGVIADVTVTQRYENAGKRPINARYVFPASTRAAVHGLRMAIGKQLIEAQIQERKRAQETFERAKSAGKSATLLEQERPNVFTMSVANVMPGDQIEVTLRYTELLVPTAGEYEFVYPTVVGPRYSNQNAATAPPTDRFVNSGYTGQGQPPSSRFELSGTLSTGMPVQELQSSTHTLASSFDNANFVRFALGASHPAPNDRDFVLHYRLAGDAIQSGLTLYDAGGEQFFLLLVQPPRRVTQALLPPREYVFVVDVSGSMNGFPLDVSKKLLSDLVSALRPIDKFNVILFSGGSRLLAPRSLPASRENVAEALRIIDQEQGGGGTELVPALEQALTLSPEAGLSRSFVVVTDGYISADKQAMDHVRGHLGDANVFAFGIGSSVNRYLIEALARAGAGEPFVVIDPKAAPAAAARFREYVGSPVLTDLRVDYQGFDAYDVEPPALPDVLAERPVVIHGKWRGSAKGTVALSGRSGQGEYRQRFDVSQVLPRAENRALSYLWARTRIANLSDFGAEGEALPATRDAVTALGLKYNLLTQYTSFVAVSKIVRNHGGAADDVQQPLALPAGVSNSAIGVQSAAEPELWLLLLLLLLGAGIELARQRRARMLAP